MYLILIIKTEFYMIFLLKNNLLNVLLTSLVFVFSFCQNERKNNQYVVGNQFMCQNFTVSKTVDEKMIADYLELYGEVSIHDKMLGDSDLIYRIINFPKNDFDTLIIATIYKSSNCYYMTCKFMLNLKFTPYHQGINDPKITYMCVGVPLSNQYGNNIIDLCSKNNFTQAVNTNFFLSGKCLVEVRENSGYKYAFQVHNDITDSLLNLIKRRAF
jgi:hypothetical protein